MARLFGTGLWVCAALISLGCVNAAFASGGVGLGGIPEIDPGTLGPALTVLIGGLLILGGTRLRRK